MKNQRIEYDLLGPKEIPCAAYYGIQTQRALENFPITGYRPNQELIRAMVMVKKAATMANIKYGQMENRKGRAIIQACDEIMAGKFLDQFVVDVIQGGACTSLNMNVNEVIANRAIEILGGKKGTYALISPNSHVNMSQSTNDVFPTAVRLAILELVKTLLEELKSLHETFLTKAEEFSEVIKMGRTHLQDAVPIRLGQEFMAYARVVNRDLCRIKTASVALQEVNIGATAVGTGLNASLEYIESAIQNLKEISGLPIYGSEHMVDATQNVDTLAAFSGSLKILALNLSKIANDLRLLASGPVAGLKEINLPPVQPGSSIMPGKVNPVMAEVVNQVAFQVMGNDSTVSLAAKAGQLELNVMEPVMVFNIIQSLEILANVIRVFRQKCVAGITANQERLKEMVYKSVGIVTALVPYIGYEEATKIALEVANSNKTVPEIISKKGILSEEEIKVVFSPKVMTQPSSTSIK